MARKTFLTRQNQTTPSQYPSQSPSPLLQPSRQSQESLSKSQRVLHRRKNKHPDLTVIGFAKDWVRVIELSRSIASIKTARERDIGNDGALTCLIGNGLQSGKTIRGTATHGHISPTSTLVHGHTDGEKTALQGSVTAASTFASHLLCGTRMTGC